jgi:mannose-1-phosphate guanylyltransferase/mannose-6-phosphate isomerase
MTAVRPVIMCGGAGARLWPFSRQAFPKQLLAVVGDRSLLQETAARVASDGFLPPLVVAGEDHGRIVERQLEEIGIRPAAILLEPEARNTAAVAALAAEWALAEGEDELLLLLPSDHFILDREAFVRAIQIGASCALDGGIVMLGIEPRQPSSQYGYIDAKDGPAGGARPVLSFVEKPTAAAAERFCSSGHHFWNGGIFLVRASTLVDELNAYVPAIYESVVRAFAQRASDGVFVRPEPEAFRGIENVSIDCAVMQVTKRGFVVPVEMGWSDVGSWSAVWSSSAKDCDNNVAAGDVLMIDTKNSLVRSDGSAVVVTIGLEDVVVVGTKDAVLVAPLHRSDEVKNVVQQLTSAGKACATTRPRELGFAAAPIRPSPVPVEDQYAHD